MQSKTLLFIKTILRGIWSRKRELSEVSIIGYATLAVTFLIQVGIARLLGTEDFGIYSLTIAMVAMIEVPLIVRGSEIALKILGEHWQKGELHDFKYLAEGMISYDRMLFVTVFILLCIISCVSYWAFGYSPWLFIILSLVIPAQIGFGVYKSYFTIFGKVKEMVRYELIYAVLLACLNIMGILAFGVYGLAVSMVLAMLTKTFLAYYFTKNYIPQVVPNNLQYVRTLNLTKEGMFSIIRNLFANGFNQIDIILLGFLQKPEIVALYKVGKNLASIPIKVSFPVWRYLQPKLLEAIQSNDKNKEKRLFLLEQSF